MVLSLQSPGVYINEISTLPPSVAPVATAIPAFIGHTANVNAGGLDLVNRPVEIESLLQFEEIFGLAPLLPGFTINVDASGDVPASAISDPYANANTPTAGVAARFRLRDAVRHFYDNGGGKCWIISIGDYGASAAASDLAGAHGAALDALATVDEPTMIVMPDLGAMPATDLEDSAEVDAARARFHGVLVQALNQCATLMDRVLIAELWGQDGITDGQAGIIAFRDGIGTSNLDYGAVYHPYIRSSLPFRWDEASITVRRSGLPDLPLPNLLTDATNPDTALYGLIRARLDAHTVVLPPAATMAGVYASVDRNRGVWKAPANVSIAAIADPPFAVAIDRSLNDFMNVHTTGKSINALREFAGRGALVWGARTLAGNDNEWRYINVRRFFAFVEESTKKASAPFVFEPNDANTWTKVRGLIENFLTLQWRAGALMGAKPEDAFYVRIGLGETMTAQDVLEGRMNVEIGMAVVRPAEFIVLNFYHLRPEA